MIIAMVAAYLLGVAVASLAWAVALRRARRQSRVLWRQQRAMGGQVDSLLQRTEAAVSELLALRAHLRRWPVH